MDGYGFSIWYVPTNWKELQRDYNMKHIPHITMKTNLTKIPTISEIPQCAMADNFQPLVLFKKMYAYDPIPNAVGWYCNFSVAMSHIPHMTLKYYSESCTTFPIVPKELNCFCCVADTRSLDPSRWTLLNDL